MLKTVCRGRRPRRPVGRKIDFVENGAGGTLSSSAEINTKTNISSGRDAEVVIPYKKNIVLCSTGLNTDNLFLRIPKSEIRIPNSMKVLWA